LLNPRVLVVTSEVL